MGRHRYAFSAEAMAAIRQLAAGPRPPTYRQIAEHLYRRKLTKYKLDAKILWRACRRVGIQLCTRRTRASSPAGGRRPWIAPTVRKVERIPGTCGVCGCTDERACRGGCSWVDKQHTLCSACVPIREGALL
jgi:hypothetical protein